MNARLDDENALLTQIKDEVSQKSDEIQATLKEVAGQYGTTLSTSLTSIFGSEKPFDSVVTAINDLIAKISGIVGVDGTGSDSNGSDGVSNGGFNGSTNEPTPQVKPTIASSDKETQGKSERYTFIDKKSVYPKELLKKTAETSVVDRLKLNDKDSSWDARAKYYADLGGKGTYTGSASQNKWLISKMKENSFAKGGTIGGLVKQTGEDGFILARTGEEIFSLEKIKALDGVFQRIEPFIANPNLIKLPDFVSRSASSSASIEVGSVQIVLPNVTNYDEFRNKLIRDNTFEKAVQEFTIGQALGRNTMNKYKY